jgi:hypothetical protein
MGSTRDSGVVFPNFRVFHEGTFTMNKLLIALVAGTFAATAWAQGAALQLRLLPPRLLRNPLPPTLARRRKRRT